MGEKNGGINWSVLWKSDDWMSVWIGFLILIVALAGFTMSLPKWGWLGGGSFQDKIAGWSTKVAAIAPEAESKNEPAVKEQAAALKAALDGKDRKAIAEAAAKYEAAAKAVQDKDFQKKAAKLGSDIKGGAGSTAGKVFSGDNMVKALKLLIVLLILGVIGVALMGMPVGKFIAGFPVIFILCCIAFFISENDIVKYYGLEVVFWSLIFGLIISNLFGVPDWLKAAVKTEYFIKIGLVMLGAEVLFGSIVKLGAYGIIQSVLVVAVVFYFCLWLARKVGLDDEFASILGTSVSICGVSAAIAAGGAVKGDPKKISHSISLVLLCAIPMLILMPLFAKWVGMSPVVAGAWIGGTIDTTGAVVAAGAIAGPQAMQAAVVVKMVQNVLIGLVAFLLAIWFVFKGQSATGEKPGMMEIWVRFPKFVLGFVVASLVFSFFVSEADAKAVTSFTKGIRVWWFTLAFLCIGLDTKFKELVAMGGGKPALVFLITQAFNILFTLFIAWLLFSGVFFPAPTL